MMAAAMTVLRLAVGAKQRVALREPPRKALIQRSRLPPADARFGAISRPRPRPAATARRLFLMIRFVFGEPAEAIVPRPWIDQPRPADFNDR